MKHITAVLCALLALLMLTSCAPKPAADVPEDSIFQEIILNKNKTSMAGLKVGMSLKDVLEVLGLDESEVQIDDALMDSVDPPIMYTQVETLCTYSYAENKNVEFTKTFYFENNKLIMMMYHASSDGKDYGTFYNDAVTFLNTFVENCGFEYVNGDDNAMGYDAKGYASYDAFVMPGARYRFLFQNCGVLDEIGISSASVSASSSDIQMNIEIDISFL